MQNLPTGCGVRIRPSESDLVSYCSVVRPDRSPASSISAIFYAARAIWDTATTRLWALILVATQHGKSC